MNGTLDTIEILRRQALCARYIGEMGEFTEHPDHGGRTFQCQVTGIDFDPIEDGDEVDLLLVTYMRDGERVTNANISIEMFRPDRPAIELGHIYERKTDMNPDAKLQVMQDEDGDVILGVFAPDSCGKFRWINIEFCTVGHGGGRSPHTLEALRNVMNAIRRDGDENL